MKWSAEDDDLERLAVIGLGSNLSGNYASSQTLLEAAVAALAKAGVRIRARSSWWRSAAWPDPTVPDYLNGVALVEAELPPRALLGVLMDLERGFGRRRGEPNASRTLDLDLIAYGRERVDEPGLTLPHPRAAERRFVMGPLAEIAPAWRHPVTGETAADLALAARVGREARPVARRRAALHKRPRTAI